MNIYETETGTDHITSFVVMPKHLNDNNLIFGGEMMSRLDEAAYISVKRLLRQSDCDTSVTVKTENAFHRGAKLGDIVVIRSRIQAMGTKSITIKVAAWIDHNDDGMLKKSDATYVFVSFKDGIPTPHKLPQMEQDNG